LQLYQRLFEVAQLSELAGGGQAFELVWGIGVSRWLKDEHAIDLPLLERLVEVEIDDAAGAEIRVRPRAAPAAINLSPYEALAVEGWSLAQDAARRALAGLDSEEGLSPFRTESFEPALRACQARLDPEGGYLPDRLTLSAPDPLPPGDARLSVSDRWVLYGRRRSESFILADLEKLKRSVEEAAAEDRLPGPAKTLVLGPDRGIPDDAWKPLSTRIDAELPREPTAEQGPPEHDLFFPKPFNDDQIAIVRRLERADGGGCSGSAGHGQDAHDLEHRVPLHGHRPPRARRFSWGGRSGCPTRPPSRGGPGPRHQRDGDGAGKAFASSKRQYGSCRRPWRGSSQANRPGSFVIFSRPSLVCHPATDVHSNGAGAG
jgi:hypothetical protein